MAIQKVTISFINRTDKDKLGNPLVNKNGKPYSRLSIKTTQHGEKYLSGFSDSWNKDWKIGDEVSIDVTQNGQYLNFAKVNNEAIMLERIENLEKTVRNLIERLVKIEPKKVGTTEIPYPENEINPKDIPFD